MEFSGELRCVERGVERGYEECCGRNNVVTGNGTTFLVKKGGKNLFRLLPENHPRKGWRTNQAY